MVDENGKMVKYVREPEVKEKPKRKQNPPLKKQQMGAGDQSQTLKRCAVVCVNMSMDEISAKIKEIKNANCSNGNDIDIRIDRLIDTYLHDLIAQHSPTPFEDQAIVPVRQNANAVNVNFDINELIVKFSRDWFYEEKKLQHFLPVAKQAIVPACCEGVDNLFGQVFSDFRIFIFWILEIRSIFFSFFSRNYHSKLLRSLLDGLFYSSHHLFWLP